jgi:hypothetical protein
MQASSAIKTVARKPPSKCTTHPSEDRLLYDSENRKMLCDACIKTQQLDASSLQTIE